jgi:hypothetical protein
MLKMNEKKLEETIKELSLMLLYLTSWKENEFGLRYQRSWKGYDFGILDQLTDEDLIRGAHRSKSVMITEEGIKKAKELLKRYGIEEE